MARVEKNLFRRVVMAFSGIIALSLSSACLAANEGREDLGDIWESTAVFGDKAVGGVDITDRVIVEEIIEPIGEYHYASFGKEDPFIPPYELYVNPNAKLTVTASTVATTSDGIEIPIVSPLQEAIEKLKVIGMWQLGDGERKALILNSANQGVVASIGDPVGLSGKIVDIVANGVQVRRYRLRLDGSREYEDLSIPFGDPTQIEAQSTSRVILRPGEGPMLQSDFNNINQPASYRSEK